MRITCKVGGGRPRRLPIALAAMLAGACGEVWDPEAALPGVTCTADSCSFAFPDAVSEEFLLGQGDRCQRRLLARAVCLVGNGEQVVAFGPILDAEHRPLDGQRALALVDVARLEAAHPEPCLPLTGVADSLPSPELQGAATTVDPEGALVAFFGATTTERVIRLTRDGMATRSIAAPSSDADIEPGSSRALRLSDGGVLVMRPANLPRRRAFRLEWVDPGTTWTRTLWPNGAATTPLVEDLLLGSPLRLRAFEAIADGQIIVLGESGVPIRFSRGETLTVSGVGQPRGADPQANRGAALVTLPLWQSDRGYEAGAVLVAGGGRRPAADEIDRDGATFDLYQPALDRWQTATARAPWPLRYAVPVLLPTGVIAFIGGNDDRTEVVYLDTKSAFAVSHGRARLGRPRGVYTSALLLPSGAVLVAGGYHGDPGRDEADRPEAQNPPAPVPDRGRSPTRPHPPATVGRSGWAGRSPFTSSRPSQPHPRWC